MANNSGVNQDLRVLSGVGGWTATGVLGLAAAPVEFRPTKLDRALRFAGNAAATDALWLERKFERPPADMLFWITCSPRRPNAPEVVVAIREIAEDSLIPAKPANASVMRPILSPNNRCSMPEPSAAILPLTIFPRLFSIPDLAAPLACCKTTPASSTPELAWEMMPPSMDGAMPEMAL